MNVIERKADRTTLAKLMSVFLVTAVLGLRQCRKAPWLGASRDGFVLDCVCRTPGKEDGDLYFWHAHVGAEIHLFWKARGQDREVEFKYEDAP